MSVDRIEPGPKWIRGVLDGRVVVDTRRVQLVWEHPRYPYWYIPTADVLDSGLPATSIPELPCHVKVEWGAVDHWYEEEVEVFVHPRDPYRRIDALASSRRVVVRIDGVLFADSTRPTILYETGLRPRYYLPPDDVRTDLLVASDTVTGCPYKGFAEYWTATIGGAVHPDIVWSYPKPLPESAAIAGMLCFYDERPGVAVEVDGE